MGRSASDALSCRRLWFRAAWACCGERTGLMAGAIARDGPKPPVGPMPTGPLAAAEEEGLVTVIGSKARLASNWPRL